MSIVGITGGIASGKSSVAKLFESLGAFRVDADQIGHTVLNDSEVISALVNRWGHAVLDADKIPDRSKIAKKVFAKSDTGTNDLAFLESITHPRIGRRIENLIQECRNSGKTVILDAALLHEAGWASKCNSVIFVDTTWSVRLARAEQRGWSEEDLRLREAAQLPIEEKRKRADIVIDNSGTLEDTHAQVRKIWGKITSQPFP